MLSQQSFRWWSIFNINSFSKTVQARESQVFWDRLIASRPSLCSPNPHWFHSVGCTISFVAEFALWLYPVFYLLAKQTKLFKISQLIYTEVLVNPTLFIFSSKVYVLCLSLKLVSEIKQTEVTLTESHFTIYTG